MTTVRDLRRREFFTVDNAVLDKDLSLRAMMTYMVLCRYANNNDQTCKLLLKTIMKKADLGRSAVSLAVKELESAGLISVDRSPDCANNFTLLSVEGVVRNTDGGSPPHVSGSSVIRTQNKTVSKKTNYTHLPVVERVFDYYRETIGKSNTYTLTDLRVAKGLVRLDDCLRKTKGNLKSAEELMKICVDALAADKFHMGDNDRKRPFNDWEKQLFGSESAMERWLEEAQRG